MLQSHRGEFFRGLEERFQFHHQTEEEAEVGLVLEVRGISQCAAAKARAYMAEEDK